MPRKIDHDERRREIARIVEEIVLERGIEALTIRDVAARAGFSTTIVCHYFRNKLELLVFTRQAASDRAIRTVHEALDRGDDLLQCLELLLPISAERWCDWHTWFAFWGMSPSDPVISTESYKAVSDANALFAEMIGMAQGAGRFDPHADPLVSATNVQIIINGIATLVAQDRRSWPAERQQEYLREHLVRIGYRGVGRVRRSD